MNLFALATAISITIDPIVSVNVIAHLKAEPSCAAECRIVRAALLYSTGEIAVEAFDTGTCQQSAQLTHVPLGARLTPRMTWECAGQRFAESGRVVP